MLPDTSQSQFSAKNRIPVLRASGNCNSEHNGSGPEVSSQVMGLNHFSSAMPPASGIWTCSVSSSASGTHLHPALGLNDSRNLPGEPGLPDMCTASSHF